MMTDTTARVLAMASRTQPAFWKATSTALLLLILSAEPRTDEALALREQA